MLSRGTSNASTRIRRAKSTSSVSARNYSPIKQKPMNPDIARQQALAAANYAFEQAAARRATRSHSEAGPQSRRSTDAEEGVFPPRRHSIRFTRLPPAATPLAIKTQERKLIKRNKTQEVQKVLPVIPDQPTPKDISVEAPKGVATISALLDEPLTSMDDIASAPSSYKRLRKAKSMYNPRPHASVTYHSATPLEMGPTATTRSARLDNPRPVLKAPKSFSFLRRSSGRQPNDVHRNQSQDIAIQMARDRHLEQLEGQILKKRQSSIFAPLVHRQRKVSKRTVRTDSHASYGGAISSNNEQANTVKAREKGFGSRARGLSASLKSKMKRVFRRPSGHENQLPAQHVDASRPHYGSNIMTSGIEEQYDEIPAPDEEMLSRVQSRVPSLRLVPSYPQMRSRAASISSVRSDGSTINSKSRVTSWTNSTVADTFATRQNVDKRLSIIQENGGPHVPSSSSRKYHPGGGIHFNFKAPMYGNGDGSNLSSPVDSRRVYSALMRRLDGANPNTKHDETDYGQESSYGSTEFTPSHSNGRPGSTASYRTAATIKQTPGETNEQTENTCTTEKSISSSPNKTAYSWTKEGRQTPTVATSAYRSGQRAEYPGKSLGLTPQQAANLNEQRRVENRRMLRKSRSNFFRQPTDANGISQRAAEKSSPNSQMEPRAIRVAKRGQPLRINAIDHPFRQASDIGSMSVYSRTSGGSTPMPAQSTMSLARSETSELGTAVIITNHTLNRASPTPRGGKPRNVSMKLSRDWGAWMSSQIADLENKSREGTQEADEYHMKGYINHRKEHAQINSEDTDIAHSKAVLPWQPLGAIQNAASSQSADSENESREGTEDVDEYHMKGHIHHQREHAQVDGEDTDIANSKVALPWQPLGVIRKAANPQAHLKHKSSGQMFPLINIGPPHDHSTEQRPTLSARSSSTNTAPRRISIVGDKENLLVPGSAYPRLHSVKSTQSQSSLRHRSHPQDQENTFFSNKIRPYQGPKSQIQLSELTLNQRNSSNSLPDTYIRPTSRVNMQQISDNISDEVGQNANAEGEGSISSAGLKWSPTGGQRMVDLFLSSRRGNMTRVSEDSVTPAFV